MTTKRNPNGNAGAAYGKKLESAGDLREYGFDLLTGEACGIGLRLLFDVDPQAVEILEQFWSVKLTDENNSWNHRGQEGWKSVMLTWSTIVDLMIFVLTREFPYVARVDWHTPHAIANYVEGFSTKGDYMEFRELANKLFTHDGPDGKKHSDWQVFIVSGTAGDGTRNQHFMSGRVE